MCKPGEKCPVNEESPWTTDVEAFNKAFDAQRSVDVLNKLGPVMSGVLIDLLPDGPGEDRRKLTDETRALLPEAQAAVDAERARMLDVGGRIYGDQPGGTMHGPTTQLARIDAIDNALRLARAYDAGDPVTLVELNAAITTARVMFHHEVTPALPPELRMLGRLLGVPV